MQWTTILVEKRQAVLAHQQSQASQPGQEVSAVPPGLPNLMTVQPEGRHLLSAST